MPRKNPEQAETISRRSWFRAASAAAGGVALTATLPGFAARSQEPTAGATLPNFTGPGANPHWNSVGPIISEPQKAPLILLTDRPVQLETPRNYFASGFTPNE